MQASNVELFVQINGSAIHEYQHMGTTLVEGRPGSEFSLIVRNKTNKKLAAIISVDGLSIMDGQPASEDSPGYLLSPYQTVTIPGWKLDAQSVSKFKFGDKRGSYSALSSKGTNNCGVIGLVVWDEKPRAMLHQWTPFGALGDASGGGAYSKGIMRGGLEASLNASNHTPIGSPTASSASVNNLGTEFGRQTEFGTTEVTFEKNVVVDTVALYYDDAKGLKARGIQIVPAYVPAVSPNPFPASSKISCTPPPGWYGRS